MTCFWENPLLPPTHCRHINSPNCPPLGIWPKSRTCWWSQILPFWSLEYQGRLCILTETFQKSSYFSVGEGNWVGGWVGGSEYTCACLCLWRCVYIKDLGVPKYLKKKIHFLFNKKHGAKASMTWAKSWNVIFVIRVCSVSGILSQPDSTKKLSRKIKLSKKSWQSSTFSWISGGDFDLWSLKSVTICYF